MYSRTLYELAEHCQFGATRDEHIRDRLVVGIADKELSRQFQLRADRSIFKPIDRTLSWPMSMLSKGRLDSIGKRVRDERTTAMDPKQRRSVGGAVSHNILMKDIVLH